MTLSVLAEPFMALLPHGGQHHARSNALRTLASIQLARAQRLEAETAFEQVFPPSAAHVNVSVASG